MGTWKEGAKELREGEKEHNNMSVNIKSCDSHILRVNVKPITLLMRCVFHVHRLAYLKQIF